MDTIWHVLKVEQVFEKFSSSELGLSDIEAKKRLDLYGPNKLPEAKVENVLSIFVRQFQSPLIYILLIASIVVFIMGETTDGAVIMVVLIFNAIIGAFQEGKARNTLLALKKFVETKAIVKRNDLELIIPDIEVVEGDIIVLQEGEKIPADARIIKAQNLKLDESALTGESEAVHKTSETMRDSKTHNPDKKNMVFKGTNIVSGNGLAIVVATGKRTVIGTIALEVSSIETEMPLKTNIKNLSKLIIFGAAIISIAIFILGIITGNSLREMFAVTVSMIVSIIPSGLPIAMTIILAAGVWRMSKKNALVKRLQAVEALGQARIIAVDKTGTITKNEMMVQTIFINNKTFEIGGVGYEPKGEIKLMNEITYPLNHDELLWAGKLSALSANARVMYSEEDKIWKVSGDPTEAALFVLGEKLGFKKDDVEQKIPLIGEVPFDYSLKYHATLHKDGRKNLITAVGAPESILALSDKIWTNGKDKKLSKADKELLEKTLTNISQRGLRVLAFATRKQTTTKDLDKDDIERLTFVGFFGLKDALRPEVKEMTQRATNAGLKVVMITGDHKNTAVAIAREANIYKIGDKVLTGVEIDSMPDLELKAKLQGVSIFARVTPEHKLRIIKAYKARGEIIAMTGDGVNDAPSLVAADLGVAMGITGTEVAKESSDIILLDDNFGSIVEAIEEGRSIYKTIRKVVLYLLSTSIGEVLVILGALIIGLPLPLLAAQIIWLNFVTDGFFIPAVAMEPQEVDLLNKKFNKPAKYLVDTTMATRMLLMALPMMLGTLFLFASSYENNLAKAWTLSLTLLAVFQWVNAWNCRSETESVFKMNPLENKYLIGGTLIALGFQVLAVYHPLFQKFLRTVPLGVYDWLIIVAISMTIILVDEIRKIFARKFAKIETDFETAIVR